MSDPVSQIEAADRDTLIERWTSTFGHPPPKLVRNQFLRLALAWQAQARASGMGRGSRAVGLPRMTAARPAAGTRLVRSWQGKTYQVLVTDSGFEYDGHSYRSLTAIARQITGTPWSGPQFFGTRP